MATITTQRREQLRQKIVFLVQQLNTRNEEHVVELFLNLIEEVEADIEELREQKASTHDIALLIQEMRSGFALMEKRFDSVDKRFEDMNKRFTSMQWLMGIGLSMLALLITLLTYLTKQA